jgi:hypothetical protein
MVPYTAGATPASGSDTVKDLYDVLLSTMKNGRTLGQSGRFTKLEPVIRPWVVSQVAPAGLIGRSRPIWTAPAGRVHR